jgi:hypothetical protein
MYTTSRFLSRCSPWIFSNLGRFLIKLRSRQSILCCKNGVRVYERYIFKPPNGHLQALICNNIKKYGIWNICTSDCYETYRFLTVPLIIINTTVLKFLSNVFCSMNYVNTSCTYSCVLWPVTFFGAYIIGTVRSARLVSAFSFVFVVWRMKQYVDLEYIFHTFMSLHWRC